MLVALPRHSGIDAALDYLSPVALPVGQLVRVPLGRRVVMGVAWDGGASEPADPGHPDDRAHPSHPTHPADPVAVGEAADLKPVAEVLEALPPLDAGWCELVRFAAGYYQRSLGELALTVLPPELRDVDGVQLQRRLKRLAKRSAVPSIAGEVPGAPTLPALSEDQQAVLTALAASAPATHLLHGVTGSGKTEVYLRAAEAELAKGRQVLVLVPEINLTPQLEARFAQRFPAHRLVSLHSGLTPAQRLQHWLAAHLGQAQLVLGTRMAVFASLPRLGLIVVDEEHDPSYKQQEGARYSARDLAVWRGRQANVAVLLGSATPSLETWLNATPAPEGPGRYQRLAMPRRIGDGGLPAVRLLDLQRVVGMHGSRVMREHPLAPELLAALRERVARGEQSFVLLNRRGYAPVLHCTGCGWKSGCPHCSAWRVFHKVDRSLRCHHCGFSERVPRACPVCGDPDIQPMGRGTERLEEQLAEQLPGARIGRIDADTTRSKGSLESQLAAVHAGEVDVLVGTQMVAKGHDFRRMTLVAAVNADSALFSSDFRAPERLFALLLQAAGRAGRDAAHAARSEMWIQTWYPDHPLYQALQAQDYEAFAASQLAERRVASLPPFSCLALLRAEARSQEAALGFLHEAARAAEALGALQAGVQIYPPVPAALQRVANVERAQMLLEAPLRPPLQRLLAAWVPRLQEANRGEHRVLRWAVDVDPQAI
ncbi:primosomal protein N' [Sphaerotilus microaerophilus]|uniref:Replication restart protein PriA n=1 Tax=Sphaerotilus microaerophilus TaxID=2914710 RepID=A0ABM7YTQ6_9BURK|nr:primosomal protein N' [Sphaerotilus sp. FB-5]